MSRISQDIEELERMLRDGAEMDSILAQVRFIAGQIASLEAQYATLEQEHTELQQSQPTSSPEPPLEHVRGIYYATGDSVPFCPRCYEASEGARRHLFGPVPLFNREVERWDCYTCETVYAAKPGENFLPHPRKA